MFWNRKSTAELKESSINEETGEMNFQTLHALGSEWMKLDDIIKWMKYNQEKNPNHNYHFILKCLIQTKNNKTE